MSLHQVVICVCYDIPPFPRFLRDSNTEEDLVLNTDRGRHDRGAVRVGLIGSNRKHPHQMILYDGSVRIRDGIQLVLLQLSSAKKY